MKLCKNCHTEKPVSDFYAGRGKCKSCTNAAIAHRYKTDQNFARYVKEKTRKWELANPERTKANKKKHQRKAHFKRYGLTEIEVKNMINRQDNKCACCGRQFGHTVKPLIDHCHRTNKVRGILCSRCNVGIGLAKDSPTILRNMIAYLGSGTDNGLSLGPTCITYLTDDGDKIHLNTLSPRNGEYVKREISIDNLVTLIYEMSGVLYRKLYNRAHLQPENPELQALTLRKLTDAAHTGDIGANLRPPEGDFAD